MLVSFGQRDMLPYLGVDVLVYRVYQKRYGALYVRDVIMLMYAGVVPTAVPPSGSG
jgi:hypothetical protein